jgi:hypothetical protein
VNNGINFTRFSVWITLCTLFLTAFSWVITRFEPFYGYLSFLLVSIFIYFTLNTFIFLLAAWFSYKNDEKKFLILAYVNFLFKLILVVSIPLYYRTFISPSDSNFIIPYIVIYAVFTVLETWFLSSKIRFK